jgi:hypothetical protein
MDKLLCAQLLLHCRFQARFNAPTKRDVIHDRIEAILRPCLAPTAKTISTLQHRHRRWKDGAEMESAHYPAAHCASLELAPRRVRFSTYQIRNPGEGSNGR